MADDEDNADADGDEVEEHKTPQLLTVQSASTTHHTERSAASLVDLIVLMLVFFSEECNDIL